MTVSGDWLLFLNNAIMALVFLPTLFSRKHTIALVTGLFTTVMIGVGVAGYALNSQWLPASAVTVGCISWAAMTIKSVILTRKIAPV